LPMTKCGPRRPAWGAVRKCGVIHWPMTYRWVRKAARAEADGGSGNRGGSLRAESPVPEALPIKPLLCYWLAELASCCQLRCAEGRKGSLSPTQRVAHSASMHFSWYRDLYKIGSVAGAKAVVVRVTLAVGIPL